MIKKDFLKAASTFVLILFCALLQAQLPDFSFSVVKTDETCESNGTLTFTVQNTTQGVVITYSIYLLPNTVNPITVTTQSNYAGLNSGNYLIIATQNLNGFSNSQQQSVTILNQVVPLQYQLQGQNAICISNGTITVIVTQGQGVNFEIIAGPILKPLQTSNVFTGLSAGVYLVRVYDLCGNGVVQNYTLFESPSSIDISPVNTVTIIDCNNAVISQTLTSGGGVIFYPLTLEFTTVLPNGQINVVQQTLLSGNSQLITIDQNIPIAIGETLTYTIQIVDGCGTTFNGAGAISIPENNPILSIIPSGCGNSNYEVKDALYVTVIAAPPTFGFALPYIIATSGNNEFPLNNFPAGTYNLEVTNLCGVVSTIPFTVGISTIGAPTIVVRLGCENGMGSLRIAGQVNIVSAQLIAAPPNANFPIPSDVSALLFSSPLGIYMNNLVSGTYSFLVVDECGFTYNLSATIQSYQESKTVNVIENCGSFDLFLNHATTPNISMTYQLQKFYTSGNYWGDPISTTEGAGLTLTNNTTKFNIASSGNFRIIGKNFIYGNGGSSVNCTIIIDDFEFYSLPEINSVFSFACGDGTFDVFVAAVGVSDLKYRVVAKNGVPLFIDNIIDPLFTNLVAGIYTFQLEDGCNNILVADFEVGSTQNFPISAENLCPQLNATLSVADFYFLNYQWWRGNDTSNILSTTNSLSLASFNPSTDSGDYHVRIYYAASPNSCIDIQTNFTIEMSDYILNAGENTSVQYCGNPGVIDLFTVLNGNPTSNGTWEEISNSGFLNGSNWNSSAISNGIFNFKYTDTGLCNAIDAALVEIKITTIPEDISIDVNSSICVGNTIEFVADFIENGTYLWQGPNDFSSTLQNPIIEDASLFNSGTYSLLIKVGECETEPLLVDVEVSAVPEFIVVGNCVNENSDYQLSAKPADSSINYDDFTYSWNSPTGYVGNQNPISILGKDKGIYNVTITDNLGCSTLVSYDVKGTICKIPKGISPNNDGDNDTFDLAGFDVKNLIIYSRYGRIVYEKSNYLNEWEGQDYNGNSLSDATYYYHIETLSGEKLVGWVYKIK
jgi:gliding motility-associated-like protein